LVQQSTVLASCMTQPALLVFLIPALSNLC
jgi:hypothetical protein